jgi:hypothetical protein
VSDGREQLFASLDSVVSPRLEARAAEFASEVDALADRFRGQASGIDRVRAFSNLYRQEYRVRARIVFDAAGMGSDADVLETLNPSSAHAEDLKAYVAHHLQRQRDEFEREITDHAGEAAQTKQARGLIDLQGVCEEQRELYAKRFGARAFKTKIDIAAGLYEKLHWWLALLVAVVVALIVGRYALS